MAVFSGKYQYLAEGGETVSQGACQISVEKDTGVVTPSGGIPIAFDFGDVDSLSRGDWDLELRLYTGKRLALRQFGPAFGRMADELTAAWRDRTVRCLLLEDLEEVSRFSGSIALLPATAQSAEIRIYKSNIAILPADGAALQWRLADVDSVTFDEASYGLTLTAGTQRLVISKLAKKTEEFREKLGSTFDSLRRQSAEALHSTFPFLDPDRLGQLIAIMPEGRSVRLTELATVHPKLVDALITRAVSPRLKPYFDTLRSQAMPDSLMAGFKFIRDDEEESEEPEQGGDDGTGNEQQDETPLFFWFFFPLSRTVVAWEATTGTGRATYFFKLGADAEASIASITRGLALVNFRREPVYLPDESLEQQSKFHRYAIGVRKLPDLRTLRSSYLGRAIHSSIENWTAQVNSLKNGAG